MRANPVFLAVLYHTPNELGTLLASFLVALCTYCALQLTDWRPRSSWVWLPGGGGGAALGLFALSAAPQPVLLTGLCFWCAV